MSHDKYDHLCEKCGGFKLFRYYKTDPSYHCTCHQPKAKPEPTSFWQGEGTMRRSLQERIDALEERVRKLEEE